MRRYCGTVSITGLTQSVNKTQQRLVVNDATGVYFKYQFPSLTFQGSRMKHEHSVGVLHFRNVSSFISLALWTIVMLQTEMLICECFLSITPIKESELLPKFVTGPHS